MTDVELRSGSCLSKNGLPSLPDKFVDIFITDPPYSLVTHERQRVGSNGRGRDISRSRDLCFKHLSAATRTRVAEQIGRLLRRWCLVFTDDAGLAGWRAALERAGLELVRTGVWVKEDSQPQFTGDRPAQGAEFIVIAHASDERLDWNARGRRGVWTTNIVKGSRDEPRLHETQKPLALMRQLVADFTDRGDLICDPFAGSGTTGVAARTMGRRFLGWEVNREYAAVARQRVGVTREQLDLFSVA